MLGVEIRSPPFWANIAFPKSLSFPDSWWMPQFPVGVVQKWDEIGASQTQRSLGEIIFFTAKFATGILRGSPIWAGVDMVCHQPIRLSATFPSNAKRKRSRTRAVMVMVMMMMMIRRRKQVMPPQAMQTPTSPETATEGQWASARDIRWAHPKWIVQRRCMVPRLLPSTSESANQKVVERRSEKILEIATLILWVEVYIILS